MEDDLPVNKQTKCKSQQQPCVNVFDEKKGGEHHGVVPVVYSAAAAALVLHEPGLEGTEEKNADNVAE